MKIPCNSGDIILRLGDSLTNVDDPKRLNILFLTTWYPSDHDQVAGIFVREHAKAVAKFHNVIVVHAMYSRHGQIARPLIVDERSEDGIRTVRVTWKGLPLPKTGLLCQVRAFFRAFRLIWRSDFRPDLVHAHVYSAAIPAVLLARLLRKPVVITAHSSLILLGNLLPHYRVGLRCADMILPVSIALQSSLRRMGIHGNSRIIPNAIDTDIFFPDEPVAAEAGDPVPRLLTVGISEPKGMPCLLEAIHLLKAKGKLLRLDIIGDGPLRLEHESLAARLGLLSVVTFHGSVCKDELAELYRRCTFYVQPSLWETFGVALVEAMACGKPIVATRIPVFEEKVPSRTGILVPVDDSAALASAIETMLNQYKSYNPDEIAENARKLFSHNAVGKMLSDVYLEVQKQR